MSDSSSLLLPTRGLPPSTPSGLTPNTRTEAEAALTHNISAQTDAAAPTTPLPLKENGGSRNLDDASLSEVQQAYRRPLGPIRTSSTNYENALREARKHSASSDLAADSPTSATIPFPEPGQGVVPLHAGVGAGQTELVRKSKPRGLSLGTLARQQSWNAQDMKHMMQGGLMDDAKEDAGYGSGTVTLAVGRS